jgi:hypothetical protein
VLRVRAVSQESGELLSHFQSRYVRTQPSVRIVPRALGHDARFRFSSRHLQILRQQYDRLASCRRVDGFKATSGRAASPGLEAALMQGVWLRIRARQPGTGATLAPNVCCCR